jgi:hypothetical protein
MLLTVQRGESRGHSEINARYVDGIFLYPSDISRDNITVVLQNEPLIRKGKIKNRLQCKTGSTESRYELQSVFKPFYDLTETAPRVPGVHGTL